MAFASKRYDKRYDWTLYLRQILFENRTISLWLGHDRLCLSRALQLWRLTAATTGPLVQPAQLQLHASEQRIWELEEENARLRSQVMSLKIMAASPTPTPSQQPSPARQQRRAESARLRLEAALASQLHAEEARLAQASAALEALRRAVEEREEHQLGQQALRSHEVGETQLAALASFRARRSAPQAWRVLRAHARTVAAPGHRAREQEEVTRGFAELQAVQEGRDALSWRVKELHAQLIVLRGQSAAAWADGNSSIGGGGEWGFYPAGMNGELAVVAAVTPGELV